MNFREIWGGGFLARFLRSGIFFILLLVLLATCGDTSSDGADNANGPGDPAAGKDLFHNTQEMTGAPTCSTCHPVEPGQPDIDGPNLSSVALRAGQRVPDQSAEAYLRESIVDPYAYVLPGYQSGIMIRNYEEYLSPQQIDDLVAYLMTLE